MGHPRRGRRGSGSQGATAARGSPSARRRDQGDATSRRRRSATSTITRSPSKMTSRHVPRPAAAGVRMRECGGDAHGTIDLRLQALEQPAIYGRPRAHRSDHRAGHKPPARPDKQRRPAATFMPRDAKVAGQLPAASTRLRYRSDSGLETHVRTLTGCTHVFESLKLGFSIERNDTWPLRRRARRVPQMP
jgi:hypothetical protein